MDNAEPSRTETEGVSEVDRNDDEIESGDSAPSTSQASTKIGKNNETTDGTPDLPKKGRRVRRGVTNAMRAERQAETVKSELITQSKDTAYLNPLSAEGIKAFQELTRKARKPQRLVLPPLKGNKTASMPHKTAASSNVFTKPVPRYFNPLLANKKSAKSSSNSPPLTASPRVSAVSTSAISSDLRKNRIKDDATSMPPLIPPVTIKIEEPVVKTEVDEDTIPPAYITADLSWNLEHGKGHGTAHGLMSSWNMEKHGTGEQTVKLELEDQFEEPNSQPLYQEQQPATYMDERSRVQPVYNATGAAFTSRYQKRQADLQLQTAAYWRKNVYETLRDCTNSIRRYVRKGEEETYITQDLIFMMAEFLKPALIRLDQIEEQKEDPTIGQDFTSQENLEKASAKMMDRVARQEAEQYSDDFTPIVKFARAFSTFADRFTTLSKEMIRFSEEDDLSQFRRQDDLAFLNYGEQILIDPRADEYSGHNEDMNEEEDEDTAQFGSSYWDTTEDFQPGAKRRRKIPPTEVRVLSVNERMNHYDGDSSVIHSKRNIINSKTASKPTWKTAHMKTCPYCQEHIPVEEKLIEHVRRQHFAEWKGFATLVCKWKPHCDFRTLKKQYMDDHMIDCHDDKFNAWVKQDRMRLEDSTCPFCTIPMYNIHLFHEHLEEYHKELSNAAFNNNLPYIGCGSCSFSSFWACDVFEHWRDNPTCQGPLVLHKITHENKRTQPQDMPSGSRHPMINGGRPLVKVVRPSTTTTGVRPTNRMVNGQPLFVHGNVLMMPLAERAILQTDSSMLSVATNQARRNAVRPVAATAAECSSTEPGCSSAQFPSTLYPSTTINDRSRDLHREIRYEDERALLEYPADYSHSSQPIDDDKIKKEEDIY